MSWWMWLLAAAALAAVVIGYCVLLVGRLTEERYGGLLTLDTPEARAALRDDDAA